MATTTTIQTTTTTQMSGAKDSAQELVDNALKVNTKPLWTQMAKLNPPEPNPTCVPYIWRYDEVRPTLLRSGEIITEQQAERRVLMLVNPARDAPYTTDTLYAGLQLVMPNETAKAHRHTAFAMRFIIEGQGGFTAVHGRRISMQRGDVILTPTWNWHDHGKDGSGPMIWLDGLDLPNFRHFPVHFVEHYQQPRYPADDVDSNESPIVFPWKVMQQRLDEKKADTDWASEDYLKKDGRPVSKILGGSAERLNAGCSSPAVRETASSVYHVVTGTGYSEIHGQRIQWKQGDTFCVPAWNKYRHTAEGDETVYLYRFHDKPMLTSLGFYRVEGCDEESLVSD
ncbi:hypothetical protein LTR99_001180 [Exophiala xenobiotica]|uniref:Cupin type-2 domain-containing protein n=1 Tax=Vermiconidia calcicola TaxID=1690605 RepID=A0AAV9QNA0_9PEZI|nr:hypothetical protein LTR72_001409 [Exophiala xenobiotica]KAK5545741.1 hypothetical protein LTR25_000750 [Vermiconidia calcicola]KAK5549998.1 hypothetical protein LTR23_000290 [Chaetothyriales sp. CCFEE 6169]KAK5271663.1 hypothetical protein LTR96_003489 [Exophiala xenobiotica]KAK5295843.1 hypothetical protein LTR14_003472 [Exophiala xenobiotica]